MRITNPDEYFSEKVKRLAIIALVSSDYLMEQLVLKGGNAIDLIYQLSGRASIDLDFSIESQFDTGELEQIQSKLAPLFTQTFEPEGLHVFDLKFYDKPSGPTQIPFWGGYKIEFKVISKQLLKQLPDLDALRRQSAVIGPKQKRVFEIDISKYEYTKGKTPHTMEGYRVYVYSTQMLVFEKIRAICQQLPEYVQLVPTHTPVPRARDFFDIYVLLERFPIDFSSESNKQLLAAIFQAKHVPLGFVSLVPNYRDFHSADFDSVRDTVKANVKLNDFDFYFDYVLDRLKYLDLHNPFG